MGLAMRARLHGLLGPVTRHGGGRLAVKVGLDVLAVVLSVVAAYLIRFESWPPPGRYAIQSVFAAAILPALRVVAWRLTGIYRQSWRLFGLREAIHLALACALVTVFLVLVRLVMPWIQPGLMVMPFGVIALEGFFTLAGTVTARVAARMVDEHTVRELVRKQAGRVPRRAILVGAGRAGQLAARELRNRPDAGYTPVGFLDDDRLRQGQVIEGLRVLGNTFDAAEIIAQTHAEVFILTMPSASRAEIRTVVERCRTTELPVRTVPGFFELLGERVEITKIRPLKIEDLLGREVVGFDEPAWERVRQVFAGKRILVTGAGGSIGSELCRQLATLQPAQLVLFENNENNLFEIEAELRELAGPAVVPALGDVRDEAELERIFVRHRPEVVFHAAAFKHVPMMERHPAAAIDNNVRGTRRMVEAAHRHGVERFLFVSTDKAVNPTNVMGASKRVAELVVLARGASSPTKFSCVRFGNVLGSKGSVIHTFRRQIERGGPVTVTHPDVTRFFMTIPEAVRLVLEAAAAGEGGEVFLLDMGEPVKILDMARQMIELAGFTPEEVPVEIVGLRPGEKLHEELLRAEEGARLSSVKGVFLAKLADVEPEQVGAWLRSLEAAADSQDTDAIMRLLEASAGYVPASPAEVVESKDSEVAAEPADSRPAHAVS